MKTLILALVCTAAVMVNIHSYSITDIDGNEISLSSFSGKKILIVNTASGGDRVEQYAGLDSLYQMYHDSLVIIAFPSNDFSNEPMSDSAIKSFVQTNYHVHYILASKAIVTGENQNALYQWLTKDSLNSAVSTDIQSDFYKFLIDENGELMGVYAGEVKPMDSILINAIGLPTSGE